jgi:hypothetical protein
MLVVVHVDDFMCSGEVKDLKWFYDSLATKFELNKTLITKDREEEVKYLGRIIKWTYDDHDYEGHFEVEGDDRHVRLLLDEWGMVSCKGVDSALTKAGLETINTSNVLNEEDSKRVRRAIARMNYMAQNRPDLSVVSRVIDLGGMTVSHWSKTQLNVALSSGEAELNAAVKALSEAIGLKQLFEETVSRTRVVPLSLHVDANACRGMLLRHGGRD